MPGWAFVICTLPGVWHCVALPKLRHVGWPAAAATGAAAIANAAPTPAAMLTIVIVLSFMMFPSSISTGGHGHRLRRCSDVDWCRRRRPALHQIAQKLRHGPGHPKVRARRGIG